MNVFSVYMTTWATGHIHMLHGGGAGLYPLPTHGQTTTIGTDKLGVNIEMVSL